VSEFKIYKASAGSGKTFQLTRHYLELLFRDTANYKSILAVTFTNKAAGELKERVIRELVRMSSPGSAGSGHFEYLCEVFNRDGDTIQKRARSILQNILHDYGHFNIGTIDHFFQQVLRAFSREAGIHSSYKLELNSDNFLKGSIGLLMDDLGQDPKLMGWLAKWVDYKISRDESWARIESELKSIGYEFLREQLLENLFDNWLEQYSGENIAALESTIISIEKAFAKKLSDISTETENILREKGMGPGDFKGGSARSVPAYLLAASDDIKFLQRKRPVKALESPEEWYTKSMSEREKSLVVMAMEGGLASLLKEMLVFLEKDEPVYYTAVIIRQNLFSLGITGKLIEYLNRFSDLTNSLLINLTSPILSKIIGNNPSPFIYEKTGTYYDHFMIDEFQDTSNLQWKNFLPLLRNSLAEDNFSMVVGDVKQSIFRWRNSNWRLMAEKAGQDMKRFGVETRMLDSNWRSRDVVIDFNNDFFDKAPARIVERIKEDLGDYDENVSAIPDEIAGLYEEAVQKKGLKRPGGYVELNFQGDTGDESWDLRIPEIVTELQLKHGYRPEDIVFLVRKNAQVKSLVSLLQAYRQEKDPGEGVSFDIVSSESYELQNSAPVRCIIWAARYVMNPGEQYFQARLAQEYISLKRKELSGRDYEKLLLLKDEPGIFRELVPDDLVDRRDIYSCSSASRFVEEMIRIFMLQGDPDNAPYLMALRDEAINGLGGTGSLEDLLEWWDDKGSSKTIPMAEQTGSLRILTIHKAKGLEFKVVIIPYCDWEMGQVNYGHTLWVDTVNTPFNMVPLVPMQYGTLMSRSSYANAYYEEKLQIYLDNLNLLYVAFTRACDRLYAFCPALSKRSSYPVSRLIGDTLGIDPTVGSINKYGNEGTVPSYAGGKEGPLKFRLEAFDPGPFEGITGLRRDFETGPVHRGRVMHGILEDTVYIKDLEKAVMAKAESGEISAEEAPVILEHLFGLLHREDIFPWFSGNYKVHRERSVIVPGVGEYRPDRIMENDDELIILDYKFGEPRKSHEKQVSEYRDVFMQMASGKIRSFLLYPETGLLKEV
jgi:ATP-dependent exoDNAse (exonuclease V) beta subunit